MGRKRSKRRAADLILRFVFSPTAEDLELERKHGFDHVLSWLQRPETHKLLRLPSCPICPSVTAPVAAQKGRPK